MGANILQEIVATDTYFVPKIRRIAITKRITNTSGARASKTPNPVAAPFPPLNPEKIVKLWPMIAIKPIDICT